MASRCVPTVLVAGAPATAPAPRGVESSSCVAWPVGGWYGSRLHSGLHSGGGLRTYVGTCVGGCIRAPAFKRKRSQLNSELLKNAPDLLAPSSLRRASLSVCCSNHRLRHACVELRAQLFQMAPRTDARWHSIRQPVYVRLCATWPPHTVRLRDGMLWICYGY